MGSEWRTFSNEKDTKDASRVGAAEVRIPLTGLLSLHIVLQRVELTGFWPVDFLLVLVGYSSTNFTQSTCYPRPRREV